MITVYSTLAQYLPYWNRSSLAPCKTAEGTISRANLISRYILPCIGDVVLKEYTEAHVRKLNQYTASECPSIHSRIMALMTFRHAMNDAVQTGLIAESWCEHLSFPTYSQEKIRIYTSGEVESIFHALAGEPMFNYYRLVYYTGIRKSECLGLRLDDYHEAEKILMIRHRLWKKRNHLAELMPITTPESVRKICLTKEADTVIQDELERRKEKMRSPWWIDYQNNLIFVNRTGTPLDVAGNTVKAKLIVREVTGIEDFSSLNLRYTAIYAAFSTGASMKVIQDLMGYADLTSVKTAVNRVCLPESLPGYKTPYA